MKEKQLFCKSIETLLYSWGSDTPPEVMWGLNELIQWYEAEYKVKINMEFEEYGSNAAEVVEAIKNS